jgi:pimeloyl-ACP methyl ester carboxylesterase
MTLQEHSEIPAAPNAPAEYITFGFGYNQAQNVATIAKELGDEHPVIEPLSDPEGLHDKSFTIAMGGLSEQVGIRKARKFIGHPANQGKEMSSTSVFQEARADELIAKLEAHQEGGPVNIIGMSADALSTGRVLVRRPDLIKSAVLAFPAGYNTSPPTFAAVGGLAKAAFKETRQKLRDGGLSEIRRMKEAREQKAKMVGGSVIPLTVAASYQAADLSRLRQKEDAPGLSIVIGAEDPMTPGGDALNTFLSPLDADYVLVTARGHGIGSNPGTLQEMRKLFPMMEQLKADRKAGLPMPPLTERMIFLDDVPQQRRDELMKIAADVDTRKGLPVSQ